MINKPWTTGIAARLTFEKQSLRYIPMQLLKKFA